MGGETLELIGHGSVESTLFFTPHAVHSLFSFLLSSARALGYPLLGCIVATVTTGLLAKVERDVPVVDLRQICRFMVKMNRAQKYMGQNTGMSGAETVHR